MSTRWAVSPARQSATTDTNPTRAELVADAITAYLAQKVQIHPEAWSQFRSEAQIGQTATFGDQA